ncbi:MAG: 6-carboxytetrahydropterin synthase QueD [Candidatus Omnitrophota bacterium]
MHEISVSMSFSAAHNLRGYRGKCEELHGHNWKVEAALKGRKLNALGMLEDFSTLKGVLKEVLALVDHTYLNDFEDFRKVNPTSENIASWVFKSLKERFSGGDAALSYVKVWETETNCACYSEP